MSHCFIHCFIHFPTVLYISPLFYTFSHCFIHCVPLFYTLFYTFPHCFIHFPTVLYISPLFYTFPNCFIHFPAVLYIVSPLKYTTHRNKYGCFYKGQFAKYDHTIQLGQCHNCICRRRPHKMFLCQKREQCAPGKGEIK